MKVFATKLSDNMERTPEGYLLCRNVPIARTGVLLYTAEEMPGHEADEDGVVRAYRDADALFAPDTIASFEGKPVTFQHPDDEENEGFVYPDNWKDFSCGMVVNVRRGVGSEDDVLLADLLIMDKGTIDAILIRKVREVSCGYDATYESMGKGLARQTHILGNHIAIVDNGRCGSRCAVKDDGKEISMAKKKGFFNTLFGDPKVQRALDEAAAELEKTNTDSEKGEGGGEDPKPVQPATDDGTAAVLEKLDELCLLMRSAMKQGTADDDVTTDSEKEEDKPGTTDTETETTDTGSEAEKAGDEEQPNKTADAAMVHRAKLLAPHLGVYEGDNATVVKKTVLRHAMSDSAVAPTIKACLGKATLDSASVRVLDAAFMAASEVKKLTNNKKTADSLPGASRSSDSSRSFITRQPVSPASINEANRKFYDKKGS